MPLHSTIYNSTWPARSRFQDLCSYHIPFWGFRVLILRSHVYKVEYPKEGVRHEPTGTVLKDLERAPEWRCAGPADYPSTPATQTKDAVKI